MTASTPSRPVVVGVDGSAASADALLAAAAEAYAGQVPVVAVHAWLVTEPGLPHESPVRLDAPTEESLEKSLHEHVTEILGATEHGAVEERVVYGYAGRVLAELSTDASLVVVGSHGSGGLRGALFGSVSQYLLEHARSPVMVVHSASRPPQRVLVGVDGSSSAAAALRWADAYATSRGLPLVAVWAREATGSAFLHPVHVRAATEQWRAAAPEQLTTWVTRALGAERAAGVQRQVDARPATGVLLEQCGADDLIVVGRRGTGGLKGLLLGSVARRVAALATGPVVVVGTSPSAQPAPT